MDGRFKARGPKDSMIVIVGDSLPANENTRERLREILDRRHIIYNSIIIPLKYYINDCLYKKTQGKYRLPVESDEDIFRYVNAIDNSSEKKSLNLGSKKGEKLISKLKKELLNEDGTDKYKMIICLGDFSYFMIRGVFEKFREGEINKYPKSGSKLTIEKIGEDFAVNVKNYNNKGHLILPILHNSSNLSFDKADKFIPADKRRVYNSYLQYVAEEIVGVMLKNEEIKKWLRQ